MGVSEETFYILTTLYFRMGSAEVRRVRQLERYSALLLRSVGIAWASTITGRAAGCRSAKPISQANFMEEVLRAGGVVLNLVPERVHVDPHVAGMCLIR